MPYMAYEVLLSEIPFESCHTAIRNAIHKAMKRIWRRSYDTISVTLLALTSTLLSYVKVVSVFICSHPQPISETRGHH